jgi:hypothetical protein
MHKKTRQQPLAALSVAVGALAVAGFTAHAQSDTTSTDNKLEQENQELRKRLDNLEQILEKEGLKPSGSGAKADPPVSAMSEVTLSGFVSTSYFYDAASTQDKHPTGYLWNTTLNSFTVNKVKLTLASPPVEKDKFDAAYRVSFIWGQDASTVDTGSVGDAGFSWIREAYVDLNIPIGTGLDVKAGELISLLNYESGDGGAVNGNWSQGYQWYYTGNPPAGAVQLGYDFNDMFGLKLRLQNGLYTGPIDADSKTFVGGFYVKPDKKTSLTFLGFVGRQDIGELVASPNYTLAGGSFIGSRQLFESHNVTFATEVDYFRFSGFNVADAGFASGPGKGDWWSAGGWLSADLVPKLGVTLRGDFIDDPTGFGTIYNSPPPGHGTASADTAFPAGIYTTGAGQQLFSATFTLDYQVTAALKLQPEIRWNHSSYAGALNGKRDQVIVGMGASYMF